MNGTTFEVFKVFTKFENHMIALEGVRTTFGKYAIVCAHAFYPKDVESLNSFLHAKNTTQLMTAERLFADFDDFYWFDSKRAAVEDHRRRFSQFYE